MNYRYIWLCFALVSFILSFLLELEGERKRAKDIKLPKYAIPYFNLDKINEGKAYQHSYFIFSLIKLPLELAFNCLFIFGFIYSKVYYLLPIQNEFLHFVSFALIISAFESLFVIPFDLYTTFYIEKKFGFSTITFSTYLKDGIKNILINFPISLLLFYILYSFINCFPNTWPIVATIIYFVFVLIINFIYPILIAPLFNQFSPLEDGPLKSKIIEVYSSIGFKIKTIFVVDSSKRTNHSNAYVTGFGKQKRIVLYDKLIEQLTIDELVAVLCHEAGHDKHKDIIKNIISMPVVMFLVFSLVSFISKSDDIFTSFGFSLEHPIIGLYLVFIVFAPIFQYFGLIPNYFSRKKEFRADSFAKETLNTATPLVSALLKLAKENLSDLAPTKLDVILNYSHPPIFDRCDALLEK